MNGNLQTFVMHSRSGAKGITTATYLLTTIGVATAADTTALLLQLQLKHKLQLQLETQQQQLLLRYRQGLSLV